MEFDGLNTKGYKLFMYILLAEIKNNFAKELLIEYFIFY